MLIWDLSSMSILFIDVHNLQFSISHFFKLGRLKDRIASISVAILLAVIRQIIHS